MKKIIHRKTGKELTISEAKALCCGLRVITGAVYIEHKSVYGYATPEIAKRANLCSVVEAYEGYTFAFVGTIHEGFEGYKVFVVAIKDLPSNFEELYPDFVVMG